MILKCHNELDIIYPLFGDLRIFIDHKEYACRDKCGELTTITLQTAGAEIDIHSLSESSAICYVDHESLEEIISWNEFINSSGMLQDNMASAEFVSLVHRSRALRKLPFESVEEAFRRMTKIFVPAGTEVTKQGEIADAFYLIVSGSAEVWQQGLYESKQRLVAELHSADSFGEESLILGGYRSATVRMTTGGELLKLSKEDFDELVKGRCIEYFEPEVAHTMLAKGAKLLDVRYKEEYDERHIPGSIHIPLCELRDRMGELDPQEKYLILCAGGKRASVANLIMQQSGFHCMTIDGGINRWPYETVQNHRCAC